MSERQRAVTGGAGDPITRRGVVLGSAAALPAAAALLLTGCATPGGSGPAGGATGAAGPQAITWSTYQLGAAREQPWNETFALAEKATGVKIEVVWEPGQGYWDKRQAEQASGTVNVDVMINQVNWVVPGGLSGMFVDHLELMRRDKIDPKQFYPTEIASWSWKGKLWAVSMQSGGELVMYNKRLFDAKGVKYPTKDWTYDDLLDTARRLNDPQGGKFGLVIGSNDLPQVMGSFVLASGGKLLSDARDRALYGDDAKSIEGAERDVDLHVKHRVTPPPEARATLPAGQQPLEVEMAAMEINHSYRVTNARAALGAGSLDFAPPPRGPAKQSAHMAGNAWSILALSKARDAAWKALRWLYSKEGAVAPQITAISWPPLVWAAGTPQWLDQFKGTGIADVARVWESGGHDILVLPEGSKAWTVMNDPLNRALKGEVGTREAMQESARQLNELFGQRPAAWKS
jgi:multiple sugar transport system substrate-binding protein